MEPYDNPMEHSLTSMHQYSNAVSVPPLPPKPRLSSDDDSNHKEFNKKGSNFLDNVFNRFRQSGNGSDLSEINNHTAPQIIPAATSSNSQYSVIVENVQQAHVTPGNATSTAVGRRQHGLINDAIFVPPPSLPLPSVATNGQGKPTNTNTINRYLLDGRTIAY